MTASTDGTAQAAGVALTPEQIQALKDEAHAAGVASVIVPAPVDENAIKEAAYKEGYSTGFAAALDEQGEAAASQDADLQPHPGTFGFNYDRDRADLVSLALFTPENQRKGGLFVVVNRLQDFLDGLATEDHEPALQFMTAIARTNAMDLASGRFKNVVIEAINTMKGEGLVNSTAEENANASEAALDRMNAAVPDLDEKPQDMVDGEEPALDPGVDINDPDSSAAAAARLAGV